MNDVYICDYVRTPIGRFGGSLSGVRPDDLAAVPLMALSKRNKNLDLEAVEEVILGCANQAGEDNRNVARMSLLLAAYPETVPGLTLNRLCGSGMDAVITAARAIKSGEVDLVVAGGVESMSRAPFVMPKAASAFSRNAEIFDTTIGALRSQQKAAVAQANGRLAKEITAVVIPQRKGEPKRVESDEHPRETSLEALGGLRTPFRDGGCVTAGNASGVNDGAAALILASEKAIKQNGLTPTARVLGGATAGVAPRIMGFGPAPASKKLMYKLGMQPSDFDVIELNEAFASQGLATLRDLEIADDDERVNPNGGAIALGHPLGMSGARITGSAVLELALTGKRRALATMCIGVGQGIAIALEAV